MDNMLTKKARVRVEAHLAVCDTCRETLQAFKSMREELGAMETIKAPDDFMEKLHERIDHPSPFDRLLRAIFVPFRIKVPLQFATATALAVIIFMVVNAPETQKSMDDRSFRYKIEKESTLPEKDVGMTESESAPAPTLEERLRSELEGDEKSRKAPVSAEVKKVERPIRIGKPAAKGKISGKRTFGSSSTVAKAPRPMISEVPAEEPATGIAMEKTVEIMLILKPEEPKDSAAGDMASEKMVDQDAEKEVSQKTARKASEKLAVEETVPAGAVRKKAEAGPQDKKDRREFFRALEKSLSPDHERDDTKSVPEDSVLKVVALIERLEGSVISSIKSKQLDQDQPVIKAIIPAKQFRTLLAELNHMGLVKPAPYTVRLDGGNVRIDIRILPSRPSP
jgi:hypothetical protein